jgi:hypothetical protein
MYNDQPMHRSSDSHTLSITCSASSFGTDQKIINVANLKFELVSESSIPRFELLQSEPTVHKQGFAAVESVFSDQGELDLHNFLFDSGFEWISIFKPPSHLDHHSSLSRTEFQTL